MKRFLVWLLVVAVAGFGLGSGAAYGRHALWGGPPQQVGGAISPGATGNAATAGPASPQPTATPNGLSSQAASPAPTGQPTPTPQTGAPPVPGRTGVPAGKPGTDQAARRNLTGTIESLSGDSLVLATRQGTVTVTLVRDTAIQQVQPATRSDLVPRVAVAAVLPSQGAAARTVIISAQGVPPALALAVAGGSGQRAALVSGTVSKVSEDSVAVDTSQGTVTLTLGPDTILQKMANADRGVLGPGATVFVLGSPAPGQPALTATAIVLMPAPARQP